MGLENIKDTELLSGEELEKNLGVSRTTLWRLRQQGMPTRRIGKSIRYDLKEVMSWLETVEETPPSQMAMFTSELPTMFARSITVERPSEELLPCNWSESVAYDPKHRPQRPNSPSSTVRRDWRKYPQEAHLLDVKNGRYRKFTPEEVGILQGFPKEWATNLGLTDRERIAGFGNAVPPPVAEILLRTLRDFIDGDISRYVEICAGFGGLALGAHRAFGSPPVALIDNWEAAVRVLRHAGHWDPSTVHLGNVQDFNWGSQKDSLDLLCGGPPCQPWSQGGKSLGAADERDLLGKMPEILSSIRPKAFLFENVPGLVAGENRPYAEWLVELLRNSSGPNSYGVAVGTLQAADFGVPQKRRRVFIVGVRGATSSKIHEFFDAVYQARTHSSPKRAIPRGLNPWVTIAEAIQDWGRSNLPWRKWIDASSAGTSDEDSDLPLQIEERPEPGNNVSPETPRA